MASLLMQPAEYSGAAEKLAIAREQHQQHARFPAQGGDSSEGGHHHHHHQKAEGNGNGNRSRARKGKNGQKKQPQRGLGVAQLEKLRLQEQSKIDAAANFASMQSSQARYPFASSDHHHHHHNHHHHQSGGVVFTRQMIAPAPHHAVTISTSHCHNGPLAATGDGFRTLLAFASSDPPGVGTRYRHGRAPMSLPSNRHKVDISEVPYICNNNNKGRASSNSPVGNDQDSSPKHMVSPPKLAPYYANAASSWPSAVDSSSQALAMGKGVEDRRKLLDVDGAKVSSPHAFSLGADDVLDAGVINGKLLPSVEDSAEGLPVVTRTNLHYVEPFPGLASARHLPRDHTNVVVGVASNCDRLKELSSFQSFSSNHARSTIEKTCGRKRPWYNRHESVCRVLHSESLDLNVPAGEIEVVHMKSVAQGEEGASGAHYTTGIIRSALGNSSPLLKIRPCATWEDNEAPNVIQDDGISDESSKGHCTPESKSKDSCSSVCPSALTLNRHRCFTSPEMPVTVKTDHQNSGDFLTLGLSSYPGSPQLEGEVNSQETMNMEDVHRTKGLDVFHEEDDNLQLQMCNPQQELTPTVKGELYFPSHASHKFLAAVGNEAAVHARLSCNFFPISTFNMMEDCHKPSRRLEEESLDLRLKLAL